MPWPPARRGSAWSLKADLRPGVTSALTSKVETVERYLAQG
jgi:hypothetical protein